MRGALFALYLFVAACGKVGDPLPPFIRIPVPVKDLAVSQSGEGIVVTWTNPALNIDGSAATDLGRIQIRSNDSIVATVDVSAPGKPQSLSLPAAGRQTFTVVVETTGGKLSDMSNAASIDPVAVPGRVAGLRAVVDQRRITLQWEPPQQRPELADGYLVTRSDTGESQIVTEPRYEDSQYEAGKVLTYQVTAIRKTPEATIPGIGSEPLAVTVRDKTPPQIPSGLDGVRDDKGAFITWAANDETDMAGYHVFRSERPDGGFVPLTDKLITIFSYFDPSSKPGLYYAVSAVDEFTNESARSAPFRVP
jgi:hypothetical protein